MLLALYVVTALLHLLLARIGEFYRYEAYLVVLGIVAVTISIAELQSEVLSLNPIRRVTSISLAVLVGFSLLAFRGINALRITVRATTNIYEQQYQMGMFLREFYDGASIAANDIGAINYLADIQCTDLFGLANMEVAELKRRNAYTTQNIFDLTKKRKVKAAIIYDRWLSGFGGVPPQWVKIGTWTISNNVVCGEATVAFYAVDPGEEKSLTEAIKSFSSHLPPQVVQTGLWTTKQ
jgi:hypothetical protein